VNLPGSSQGAKESLEAILGGLAHGLDMIAERTLIMVNFDPKMVHLFVSSVERVVIQHRITKIKHNRPQYSKIP